MARPKGKRENILASATDVFSNKGFHMTNIMDIANHAGIGKGTVYEYFDSKSDLFIEVLKFNTESFLNRIKSSIDAVDGFLPKLNTFIETHRAIVGENFQLTGLFISNPGAMKNVAENGQEVMKILYDGRERSAMLVHSILDLGVSEHMIKSANLELISDLFLEMLLKCNLRVYFKSLSTEQAQQEQQQLIDFLLNGIGE